MRYRRTRRDANHKDVVAALAGVGASVVDLAACGKGVPDLLVGYRGRTWLLEVKNPAHRRKSGSTNPTTGAKQEAFRASWRGEPVQVVETVDEALRAVQAAAAEV